MSQRELSEALAQSGNKKSPSYIAGLETGEITPPDRTTCLAIGSALGLPNPEAAWLAAAPDRLARLDPDLAAWVAAGGPVASERATRESAEARASAAEAQLEAVRAIVVR